MKHSSTCSHFRIFFFRSSKRMVRGLLLITLLMLQAKIILDGCFIIPFLPAAQQSSMEYMGGPCAELDTSAERVCLENCEYSANKPKLIGQQLLLFDTIVGLPAIFVVTFLSVGISRYTEYSTLTPSMGPPLYLLFLRLLIPSPHH